MRSDGGNRVRRGRLRTIDASDVRRVERADSPGDLQDTRAMHRRVRARSGHKRARSIPRRRARTHGSTAVRRRARVSRLARRARSWSRARRARARSRRQPLPRVAAESLGARVWTARVSLRRDGRPVRSWPARGGSRGAFHHGAVRDGREICRANAHRRRPRTALTRAAVLALDRARRRTPLSDLVASLRSHEDDLSVEAASLDADVCLARLIEGQAQRDARRELLVREQREELREVFA